MITSATNFCLVIGDPIEHSLSPVMHNAAFRAAGLQDRFVFLAARVLAEDLSAAMRGCRALNVRGVSVTMPHKDAVRSELDEIDPIADRIGAVNTVVNRDGRLTGYNTDVNGVVDPIARRVSIGGKRAVVIGAGGAARAAAFGLQAAGAEVIIANRGADRGKALAQALGTDYIPIADVRSLTAADILVNTTPVGMSPDTETSPVTAAVFHQGQVVLDAIYRPAETRFLRDAALHGAVTISGIEMFVAQGARQFLLYTGREAPVQAMEEAVDLHRGES